MGAKSFAVYKCCVALDHCTALVEMSFPIKTCHACKQNAISSDSHTHVVPFVFVGHHPIRVGTLLSTWFHANVSEFAESYTVFDFLNHVYRILAFDNQIHVSHWNACLLAPCRHADGDNSPIFKLLDHNLKMNAILPYIGEFLQIHAISILDPRMHYLPTILVDTDLSYLFSTRVQTVIGANEEFDRTGPSNERYHLRQQGGHGLFQNSAMLYNARLDRTDKRMFLSTSSNSGPYAFSPYYRQLGDP